MTTDIFQPTAKIITDSYNLETGERLTTFVITFHRFILSEFNKHRMFSSNASSSRAVPVKKNTAYVESLNLQPLHWGKNQAGMSASEQFTAVELYDLQILEDWQDLKDHCLELAKKWEKFGVHKQVTNRLLELFNTITLIVTATDYENFFLQRCHPAAQPEMQALAYAMNDCYVNSKPVMIHQGQLHLPFYNNEHDKLLPLSDLIKILIGRIARVSYLNHDGKRNNDSDLALFNKLYSAQPRHYVPFEHVAIAQSENKYFANFKSFKSIRYLLEYEPEKAKELLHL